MTPVGLTWLLAVIFAVLVFVLTTIWVIYRGIRLYRKARAIEFPEHIEPEPETNPERVPAPTGNIATLTSARIARAKIKQTRRANKERRLEAAHDRWAAYGLVDERK